MTNEDITFTRFAIKRAGSMDFMHKDLYLYCELNLDWIYCPIPVVHYAALWLHEKDIIDWLASDMGQERNAIDGPLEIVRVNITYSVEQVEALA